MKATGTEKGSETVKASSAGSEKEERLSNSSSKKEPQERMANSELRGSPLSGKKDDELHNTMICGNVSNFTGEDRPHLEDKDRGRKATQKVRRGSTKNHRSAKHSHGCQK